MLKTITVVHEKAARIIPVTHNENLVQEICLGHLSRALPESRTWTIDERIEFLNLVHAEVTETREQVAV